MLSLTRVVRVRHEVALVDCPAGPRESDRTRRFPAGTLGRHAAVALMTGCEALPTRYRSRRPERMGQRRGENREEITLLVAVTGRGLEFGRYGQQRQMPSGVVIV